MNTETAGDDQRVDADAGFGKRLRCNAKSCGGGHEWLSRHDGELVGKRLARRAREVVGAGEDLQRAGNVDVSFAECPALDVLCVPGGAGVNALLQDVEVLDFLRARAAQARYLSSVCTGALVLGAAGLLKGRRATTHWASHDLLAKFGAIPTHGRVVRDGNLFTAGGVTAGIDFGLTVVAELLGEEQAQTIQLQHEYAPEPPFQAGTPEAAPPAVVAATNERLASTRKAREAIIDEFLASGFAKAS